MIKRAVSLLRSGKQRRLEEGNRLKRLGDVFLNQDRLIEAADCYRRALLVEPNNPATCIGLGFVLVELKQHTEARQHLQHAVLIEPWNADANYLLGVIQLGDGDISGAAAYFEKACDDNPQLEHAHRRLVDCLIAIGDVEKAQECLDIALTIFPDQAQFWFDIGNLHAKKSNYEQAINCYQRSVVLAPSTLAVHINLANVLTDTGQLEPALEHYQLALSIQPDSFEAISGLGLVYERKKSYADAIACFARAAEIQPDDALTQVRLGVTYEAANRLEESIDCYRRATTLNHYYVLAHQRLGNALLARGMIPDAIASFQTVLVLEPGSPVKHLVNALSGRSSDGPPSAYVEQLFDEYADRFESHLVEKLKYSVPDELVELLRGVKGSDSKTWSVLDLGCGTGLFGTAIAPLASNIVGVDLSSKMLLKSSALSIYSRLIQMDLLVMMGREAACSYDLVAATDVFIYVGKLDALFAEARRLLKPGGLFAFSVESLGRPAQTARDDGANDFRLEPSGRYAHSMQYLHRLTIQSGFELVVGRETTVRMERGLPLAGDLLILRCN